MQISDAVVVDGKIRLKKVEYTRFPVRLGQDVFAKGRIEEPLQSKFMTLMEAFAKMLEIFEVDDYMICATSAMRDAENGQELKQLIKDTFDLDINIISGDEEANLISAALSGVVNQPDFVHIDVGGGSTEINLYQSGQKRGSASFKLGSVRNRIKTAEDWQPMQDWVASQIYGMNPHWMAVGTGGNMAKIMDLFNTHYRSTTTLTYADLATIYKAVEKLSMEERITRLMLNPDRADTIVPATEIYLRVMNAAKAWKITAPDVGLKDGMFQALVAKHQDTLLKSTPV